MNGERMSSRRKGELVLRPFCGGRIFTFGVQSVSNTLGREIDGEIVPSNNRCQVFFPIARAKLFPLEMPRMKTGPRRTQGPMFVETEPLSNSGRLTWMRECPHELARSVSNP